LCAKTAGLQNALSEKGRPSKSRISLFIFSDSLFSLSGGNCSILENKLNFLKKSHNLNINFANPESGFQIVKVRQSKNILTVFVELKFSLIKRVPTNNSTIKKVQVESRDSERQPAVFISRIWKILFSRAAKKLKNTESATSRNTNLSPEILNLKKNEKINQLANDN